MKIKNIFFILFLLFGQVIKSQNNFIVLSDANGIILAPSELDSLNSISDQILETIETFKPELADSFKIYDYSFFLHQKSFFENADPVLEMAINATDSQSPYYFIILKSFSRDSIVDRVYIAFNFPTDSLPCLDATSMARKLEVNANTIVRSSSLSTEICYTVDYITLKLLQNALAEGFCCSEYINSLGRSASNSKQRSQTCSMIDMDVVDSLVAFMQSDTAYNRGLEYLASAIPVLNNCNIGGEWSWKSYAPGGIIPACFWTSSADPLVPYSPGDIPFNSGCIDGLTYGIDNFLNGILATPEILKSFGDLVEAYTIYYIRCSGRHVTDEEIKIAWKTLENLDWSNNSFETNFDAITNYGQSLGLKLWSSGISLIVNDDKNNEWCDEKDKVRASVELLSKTLTSWDSLELIFIEAISSVLDIWENVDSVGRFERYYQGYYSMAITVELLPIPITKGKLFSNLSGTAEDVASCATGAGNYSLRRRFIELNCKRLFDKLLTHPEYGHLAKNTNFQLDFYENYSGLLRVSNDDRFLQTWTKFEGHNLESPIRGNVNYLENITNHSTITGRSADEIVETAKINENGIEQYFDELEETPASGYWNLDPFQRGKEIEDYLGQNLPEPFKTIDIYNNSTGAATSIKSIDLDARTYQTPSKLKNRLNKYAEELDQFTSYTLGARTVGNDQFPVNSRILKVAIPRPATGAQLDAINDVIQNWNNPTFTIEIIVLP